MSFFFHGGVCEKRYEVSKLEGEGGGGACMQT